MKVLASDFDGTLHTTQEEYTKNLEAVKEWRRAGNLFGIVTGRSIEMMNPWLEDEQLEADFLVCNNGSSIYDKEGHPLICCCIDTDLLVDLLSLPACRKSFHYLLNTEDGILALLLDERSWALRKEFKVKPITWKQVEQTKQLYQISMLFELPREAAACTSEVNRYFGHKVTAHLNKECVDITPKGVDKAEGIREALRQQKINCESVYAVGDGENDLPMIEGFRGFTVTGAAEEVKMRAPKVYESVAYFIKATI